MILKSVHIKNFRNLEEVNLKFSDFDVLVGENNVGKTNIMNAVCSALSRKIYFNDGDFKDPEMAITIELNFGELDNREEEATFF